MIVKIDNAYLDYNEDIDIERQIKLFEKLSTTDGDFSYQFEIQNTSHNNSILGYPLPDNISKLTYQKITCELLSNNGDLLYSGFLRIEGINTSVIKLSFFSGNNNWFGLLSGLLTELNISDLDCDQTTDVLSDKCNNNEGIVFPLIDSGTIITRSYPQLMVEDFVAGIYVKTMFKRIFTKHSIKIQGDLLDDPFYNGLISIKSNRSQTDIDANSSNVLKYSSPATIINDSGDALFQLNSSLNLLDIFSIGDSASVVNATGGGYNGTYAVSFVGTNTLKFSGLAYTSNQSATVSKSPNARPSEFTFYKVTFDNDSDFPYFDGTNNNFDIITSTFVAPYKMMVRVEAELIPQIVDASYNQRLALYINGVSDIIRYKSGSTETFSIDRNVILETGDTLELYSAWQQSGGSTQNDIIGGTIKITPVFIYHINGEAVLPKWTQQQYVSNILQAFNCITYFDSVSQTLTINLLEKLQHKDSIDLSDYITDTEVDYSNFISNYGKKNILSYNEVDQEDIRKYNVINFFKYGTGVIEANNDFLEDSVDLVESDFSNPIGYINNLLGGMSLEKLDILSIEVGSSEDDTSTITITDDGSGRALCTLPGFIDFFKVNDLIRISDSTVDGYNGDWIVDVQTTGVLKFLGLDFIANGTARITRLFHKYKDTDAVYLLYNIPCYSLSNYSSLTSLNIDALTVTSYPVAFFSLLNSGKTINSSFKQSLSFGEISNTLFYQRTIVESYWGITKRILNDPVKLICKATIPYNIFLRLIFLNPITIKTIETSNRYYLDRHTSYKGSEYECVLELIKLP